MPSWMIKNYGFSILRDKKTDDPDPGNPNPDTKPNPDPAPTKKDGQVVMTQEQFEKLMEKLEGKKDPANDPDLFNKSKKSQEDKDKANNDSKRLEAALKFTIGAKDWIKENQSLLPKDVVGIMEAAEKEKYDSAIDKDNAIKSGIVQAFFHVQENLDLLTSSQKSTIEDFLKMSKTGKEEKAQQLYDSIFEPCFEMKKRISKAQQLNRQGERSSDDAEEAYKQRLIQGSKQHYTGVKPQ